MDETISSVLAQSFKSWELLFVDDGSTDGSSEKAKRYADLYPDQIRYFEHDGHANLGQSSSRNLAIQHARGEYIAFLDVDDFWLPEKLERQVATLDENQEAAMNYGPYFIWHSWTGHPDDLTRDIRGDIGTGQEYDSVTLPPTMLLQHILNENGLPAPCGAMVRRIVLENIRGFEEEFLGVYEDEAFFAKIALNHPVYVSSGCWDRYRQHADSYCERAVREGVWNKNPSVTSDHKIRFLRWLLGYVSLNARFKRSELLGALQSKMERLGSLLEVRFGIGGSLHSPSSRGDHAQGRISRKNRAGHVAWRPRQACMVTIALTVQAARSTSVPLDRDEPAEEDK